MFFARGFGAPRRIGSASSLSSYGHEASTTALLAPLNLLSVVSRNGAAVAVRALSGFGMLMSETKNDPCFPKGMPVAQRGQKLGEMWRALTDEQKQVYNEKAKAFTAAKKATAPREQTEATDDATIVSEAIVSETIVSESSSNTDAAAPSSLEDTQTTAAETVTGEEQEGDSGATPLASDPAVADDVATLPPRQRTTKHRSSSAKKKAGSAKKPVQKKAAAAVRKIKRPPPKTKASVTKKAKAASTSKPATKKRPLQKPATGKNGKKK